MLSTTTTNIKQKTQEKIEFNFSTTLVNPKAAIFPISIIAQILGVHQRTLRIYDEEGILSPKRTNIKTTNITAIIPPININSV